MFKLHRNELFHIQMNLEMKLILNFIQLNSVDLNYYISKEILQE